MTDRLSHTSDDDRWLAHRGRLVDEAYRILGDVGAAEDAAHEAFARLLRTQPGSIDDERAWLVVVTTRICLDELRSARARRSTPTPAAALDDQALPGADDPADRTTLADRVETALQVVLARLTPAERVVFVLHDVFQVPFERIATTVGRPAPSCRQLASRARRRIAGDDATRRLLGHGRDAQRVTESFIDACSGGDLDALVALLDPEVSGDADLGPDMPRPSAVVGADAVARRTLVYLGRGAVLVSHPRAQGPAVLAYTDRRLLASIELRIEGGRITHLHADGDPRRLAALEADLGS